MPQTETTRRQDLELSIRVYPASDKPITILVGESHTQLDRGEIAWLIGELQQALTAERLEYLRGELRAERISYSELAELQDLRDEIDPSDVELLEAAGVPEHPES